MKTRHRRVHPRENFHLKIAFHICVFIVIVLVIVIIVVVEFVIIIIVIIITIVTGVWRIDYLLNCSTRDRCSIIPVLVERGRIGAS